MVDGVCDEGDLELGKDPVPKIKVANVLKRIVRNLITYDNALPMRYLMLQSERQAKYVKYIVVTIDTENLDISSKEVIQVI